MAAIGGGIRFVSEINWYNLSRYKFALSLLHSLAIIKIIAIDRPCYVPGSCTA